VQQLRGHRRRVAIGSSFSSPSAATVIAKKKSLLETAQQHFQERLLLAETKGTSTTTAITPFGIDAGDDVVSIIQESLQSFLTNSIDLKDARRRIKDAGRMLGTTTTIADQNDLTSIIQETMHMFQKYYYDQEEHALADDTRLRVEDAVRKLNAVLSSEQQSLRHAQQEESTTTNNDNTAMMMSAIIHDLTMAMEEENGEMNALVDKIKGWQSSMDDFHEMEKAAPEFRPLRRLFSLSSIFGDVGEQGDLNDFCNKLNPGDVTGCLILLAIPIVLVGVVLAPIAIIVFIISLPILIPAVILLIVIAILSGIIAGIEKPVGDTTAINSMIQDATRKLNAMMTRAEQQQEESTTNEGTIMSAITHDLTTVLEESGGMDAMVALINGWQSSLATFHDHHQMDTTTTDVASLLSGIAVFLFYGIAFFVVIITLPITLPLHLIMEIIGNILAGKQDELFHDKTPKW
jgi:hypothetical protein